MAATEFWSPNVAKATKLLHPLGVVVVAAPDESALPFADEAFDLVTSRHPAAMWWTEIARVLRLGGTYFAFVLLRFRPHRTHHQALAPVYHKLALAQW